MHHLLSNKDFGAANVTKSLILQIGSTLGFFLIASAPARSAILTYNDTTNSGGATFEAFVFGAQASPFDVFHFRVDTNGRYDFSSSSTPWQNVISLYEDSFNPSNSFSNLLNSSTQSPVLGVSTSTFFVPSLFAGTDYFLVTSGYKSTDFGSFTNTISGVGNILPSTTTAVPEPFSIVGTLIGGTAAMRMRKKLANSHKA
jgi:hypothetical protein